MPQMTKQAWVERRFGPPPALELSDVEAAWIACAIDGEGTIAIQLNNSKGRRSRYRAKVYVCNTNMDFLMHLASLVDGSISLKNMPHVPGYKRCYQVFIRARAIKQLLERVLPFLIIKRRQAELVLALCNAIETAPLHMPSNHELFERLWQECKALNKRGVS